MTERLVVLGGVAVLGASLLCMLLWQLQRGRALDYLSLYLFVALFDLAVHPLYVLSTGAARDLGPYLQLGYYRLFDGAMAAGVLIALLHVLALVTGYSLLPLPSSTAVPGGGARPLLRRLTRPGILLAVLGLLGAYVALFAVRLLAVFGSVAGFAQFYMRDRLRSLMHVADRSAVASELAVLGMLTNIVGAAWALSLLCLALRLHTGERRYGRLYLAFLAILLPALALNGYRQMFVVYGLSVALVYFALSGRRFGWRHVALAALPALGFVTVLTVLQSLVITYAFTGEAGGSVDVVGTVVRSLSPNMGLDALAGVASYFPAREPYLMGESILDVALMWIPRSVWEAKKVVYGVDYLNALMGLPTTTTTAVTLPGEYYLNFSWAGVVILSAIQGMLFRVVDAVKFRSDASLFLYLAFVSGTNAMYGMGIISVAWTAASLARMAAFLAVLVSIAAALAWAARAARRPVLAPIAPHT